jgi:hypothetical protein
VHTLLLSVHVDLSKVLRADGHSCIFVPHGMRDEAQPQRFHVHANTLTSRKIMG